MSSLDTQHEPAKLWHKDFILIVLVNLVIFISFQMILPILPLYAVELGGSETDVGIIVGVFTISAVLIRPYAGRLLDSGSRRWPFLMGLAVFIVAVFGYNWAFSVMALLFLRLIHGFGWAFVTTGAGTVATDAIPRQRLGEGMGYYGMTSTLSMALAPVIGLFVVKEYGFTSLFFISTACAIAALLIAATITYRPVESKSKTKGALFEPKAYRPSITMFFLATTYGAVISFIVLFGLEKGITNIGVFFTVYAIALTVVRPFAGMLVDRKGFDMVVIPGLMMILLAMPVLSQAGSLTFFLLAGVLYGVGFGSVQPSLQALVVRDVPPQRRGAANGTFFSAFDLGIGLGAMMWGAIAQSFGYANMYLIATLPALIAVITYIFLRERDGKGVTGYVRAK